MEVATPTGAVLPSGELRVARNKRGRAPGAGAEHPRRHSSGALEDRLLRKLGAALLALPVLAMVYLASFTQRGMRARIVSVLAASAVIGLVVVASLPPAPSAAVPKSQPQPVAAELLNAVRTGHALADPFTIAFDAPMEPASVAAALRVTPESSVTFTWDTAGRVLSVAPVGHWTPDTLYTIAVSGAARGSDGGALESPVRALVLTGHAGTASLAATRLSGDRARLDTSFRIVLDRAASLAAVRSALRTEPTLAGQVTAGASDREFLFQASEELAPNTAYRVWLEGLEDADGVTFAVAPNLEVRTVQAPAVVRFRPRPGTGDAARGALVSARFTEQMDRKTTAAAFSVSVDGKPVTGKVTWAEQNTVLVFRPAAALPYGSKVVVAVAPTALSKAGVPLAATGTGTFTVVPKPAPKAAPKAAPTPRAAPPPKKKPATKPIKHSGGSGAVSGSWSSVEAYYLRLMNCTRTGGWVTSSGSCSSPGGRSVAPLALSSAISAQVSRPYAKLLATRGICNHFIGGTPGDRLRRAGFTSYRWGENLGCRSGNPYSAVLGSHLFFQDEKPYNGGHYKNLMNAEYDRAGIGVWVSGGRVRLVVDLYHP